MRKFISILFLCAVCLTLVSCTHSLPKEPNKVEIYLKTDMPPPPPEGDDDIIEI